MARFCGQRCLHQAYRTDIDPAEKSGDTDETAKNDATETTKIIAGDVDTQG
jgi:hypothetical protein